MIQKIIRYLFQILILFPIGLGLGCATTALAPSSSVTPSPTWIPKARIAFHAYDSHQQLQGVFTVYTDGTDLQLLSKNSAQAAWSPDGQQIAVKSRSGFDETILVMNRDGSNSREITPHDLAKHLWNPTWSPDGKRIAIVAGNADQSRDEPFYSIYIVELEQQTLLEIPCRALAACTDPSWSPDGKQIVFSSQQVSVSGHPIDIYVVDVTKTSQPQLLQQAAELPVWQPHGDLIAFLSTRQDKPGIFLMRPNGEIVRTLAADLGRGGMVWSPDGTRLAFSVASSPAERSDLYVIDADGSNLIRLTNSPDAFDSAPSWSPDGQQITFQSTMNEHTEIYVVNVDDTNLRRLMDNPLDQSSPVWSPK
jgi:TolB protein